MSTFEKTNHFSNLFKEINLDKELRCFQSSLTKMPAGLGIRKDPYNKQNDTIFFIKFMISTLVNTFSLSFI